MSEADRTTTSNALTRSVDPGSLVDPHAPSERQRAGIDALPV